MSHEQKLSERVARVMELAQEDTSGANEHEAARLYQSKKQRLQNSMPEMLGIIRDLCDVIVKQREALEKVQYEASMFLMHEKGGAACGKIERMAREALTLSEDIKGGA